MISMLYDNFDLQLATDETGKLVVSAPSFGESRASLDAGDLQAGLAALKAGSLHHEPARDIGTKLFRALLPANSRSRLAYESSWQEATLGGRSGNRLRLILPNVGGPHNYPWELLSFEGGFLALDRMHSVVRYIDDPTTRLERPNMRICFRILHLLFDTNDQEKAEIEAIKQRLAKVPAFSPFQLEIDQRKVDGRLSVQEALKDNYYHLVYLTGRFIKTNNSSGLQLMNGGLGSYSFPYLYSDLRHAFGSEVPPLLLSTPDGIQPGTLPDMIDLAKQLVGAGVPAAIVLPSALGTHRSIAFLSTLFNALAAFFSVDAAVVAGRTSILTDPDSVAEVAENRIPWFGTLLYTCVPDGLLYQPPVITDVEAETSQTREPARAEPEPSGPRVTIINPQQIQTGSGGQQQIGASQITIGTFNLGVAQRAAALRENRPWIRTYFHLGLSTDKQLTARSEVTSSLVGLNYPGRQVKTGITLDALKKWAEELTDLRQKLKNEQTVWAMEERAVVDKGQAFFKQLVEGDAQAQEKLNLALFQRNLNQAQYEMVLNLEHNSPLNAIPWEMMHDGQKGFLCLDYPIYRCALIHGSQPTIREKKMDNEFEKVLIVAANPERDLEGVDDEAQEISRILQAAGYRADNIRIIMSDQATRDNIDRALRKGGFQIFHFTGHGVLDFYEDTEQGSLMVGKPGNPKEYLTAEFLDKIVEDTDLRLVFLSACTTEAQQEQIGSMVPWKAASISGALVGGGVPAVVAMRWKVGEPAARSLAGEFYRWLKYEPIERVLQRARFRVKSESSLDWANPVLTKVPGVFKG